MLNPSYPIYLGVSHEFFERMQQLNVLDGDAKLTTSMAVAEADAKHFSERCDARVRGRNLREVGPVTAGMYIARQSTPSDPIIQSTKERGVVVKFDAGKLMKSYQVLVFGDEVRVSAEIIQQVLTYVTGYYDIVDVEELEPGTLYAG